jgi:alkylation response protein AidB-like acyl-CoA dehydrogenase
MAIRESLALTEDQHALLKGVHDVLADQLSSDGLRKSLDNECGFSPELHVRLTGELGLAGLTVPAEFGGRGLSQVEASVVHSELGRALYPGPVLPTHLAAAALMAADDQQAREYWLPLLASGSVTGTVAAADEVGHWSVGPESVKAEYATGGWRLYGRRWFVMAAHVAGVIMVPAVTDSGLAMFLAEAGSRGLAASRQLSLDLTRRISIMTFDAVPALLLGKDADAALARTEHEFLLATAAEAAGGISWCLDASIAYAQEREQSEDPPDSFEAVAQSCVDMLSSLQSISAAARYAAAATADGAAEAPMAARVAALRAGESYRCVTEAAIHLFGGLGSAREHDAQLYYRRAWSADRLAGGPQAHRAAITELADH